MKQAFIEPVAVGEVLPNMPLFLMPPHHVPVPLEATYQSAFEAVPKAGRMRFSKLDQRPTLARRWMDARHVRPSCRSSTPFPCKAKRHGDFSCDRRGRVYRFAPRERLLQLGHGVVVIDDSLRCTWRISSRSARRIRI